MATPADPRWTGDNKRALLARANDEAALHASAIADGGYESFKDDVVADVEATDPVEVTHETLSILFAGAATLIDCHVATGIDLQLAPDWARLVNHALDLAGIVADASAL